MRRDDAGPALLTILVLLVALLYPTLFLGRRLAPEAALRATPPWRQQWGPRTRPSPLVVEAARELGPRLAGIARDGLATALWNPSIGGGREGWLGSPREGGAPLAVAAALAARPGRIWAALVALEILASFAGAALVLRRLGIAGWGGAIGGAAFALSGPVASSWLHHQGSAVALTPWLLLPPLLAAANVTRRVAAWGFAALVAIACGPAAMAAIAAALVAEIFLAPPRGEGGRRRLGVAVGLAAGILAAAPLLWMGAQAGEPGAPAPAVAGVPLDGFRALVVPYPKGDPADLSTIAARWRQPTERGVGLIGWLTLGLAAVGVAAVGRRQRALLLAILLVTLILNFAPLDALGPASGEGRPFALMALALAVLAGAGAAHLLARARPLPGTAAGVLLTAAVVLPLFPAAAHRLPMATDEDASLVAPFDAARLGDGSRVVALLDTMPPDIGAGLGIADVRASSFRLEPTYARLLGAPVNGEIGIPRALDPSVARLGARWILEPQPLRLVSGEVFSRVEVVEESVAEQDARVVRVIVDVPPFATRLGLPAAWKGTVWLRQGTHGRILDGDATLAGESAQWRWLSVPDTWGEGPAVVEIHDKSTPNDVHLPIAWDRSGLRVASEGNELRVWEWRLATPFVSFGAGDGGGPTPAAALELVERRPARVVVDVRAAAPGRLAVQVKHRPALWHATVGGRAVATEPADEVWTGVPVPAGRSTIVLEAALPGWAWTASASGLLCLAAAVLARRRP